MLVEAAERVGGMAASFEIAGQRVDLGSHRLHPAASPRVLDLLRSLLGDDLQTRSRRGRIRLDDRWVHFPLDPVDLLVSARPRFALRAGFDLATGPLRRARHESYAEVIRAGLGPTALKAFHRPMAAKLWGRDPDELAAELAYKRVSVRSGRSLVSTVVAGRSSPPTFLYPRLGFGQIADVLAEAAAEAGVDLRLSSNVRSIEGDSPAVTTVVAGQDGSDHKVTARRVLWTAPAEQAAAACGTGAGAGGVPHRAMTLVYPVASTRGGAPSYTPYDAHYVPQPDVVFSRLSEPRNYRDGPDPDGLTVLCAEIPCDRDDALWNADDGELTDLVLDGIDRLGLPPPRMLDVAVRRLPRVYPVIDRRRANARAELLAATERLPGVTVLGRHGRAAADNLHQVMDMALSAVDRLATDRRRTDGTGWDDEGWRSDLDRFESFVVED